MDDRPGVPLEELEDDSLSEDTYDGQTGSRHEFESEALEVTNEEPGPQQPDGPDTPERSESTDDSWSSTSSDEGPAPKRKLTKDEMDALFKEKTAAQNEKNAGAERLREAEERMMRGQAPGFIIPPHRYTPEPDNSQLRPSTYNTALREQEAEERAKRGPLTANRDECSRLI